MYSIKEIMSLRWLGAFMFSAIFFVLFTISPTFATEYDWIGGSGDWSDPSNWNPGVPTPSYGSTTIANLTFSDSINRIIDGVGQTDGILIGNSGTGKVIWNISEGTNFFQSGDGVKVDSGTILNITGGGLSGDFGSPVGIMLFNSGTTVNISGGGIGGSCDVIFNGVVNLSGNGSIGSNYGGLGFYGITNQTGGIVSSSASFAIGGTYNWMGGEIQLGQSTQISNFGQFNILGNGTRYINGGVFDGGIINAYGTTYLTYITGLDVFNGTIMDINGTPGTIIYYDPTNTWDNYLGGLTYSLQGGGFLMPVPEPATMLLLGSGLLGLVWFRRRFRKA